MKKLMIASVILSVACAGLLFLRGIESTQTKTMEKLSAKQIDLLKDQLREYEFKLTTARTYEDGYRDAVIRAGGGSYGDGFNAAKSIYENENYADGYHNAIAQFGYCPVKNILPSIESKENDIETVKATNKSE